MDRYVQQIFPQFYMVANDRRQSLFSSRQKSSSQASTSSSICTRELNRNVINGFTLSNMQQHFLSFFFSLPFSSFHVFHSLRGKLFHSFLFFSFFTPLPSSVYSSYGVGYSAGRLASSSNITHRENCHHTIQIDTCNDNSSSNSNSRSKTTFHVS